MGSHGLPGGAGGEAVVGGFDPGPSKLLVSTLSEKGLTEKVENV